MNVDNVTYFTFKNEMKVCYIEKKGKVKIIFLDDWLRFLCRKLKINWLQNGCKNIHDLAANYYYNKVWHILFDRNERYLSRDLLNTRRLHSIVSSFNELDRKKCIKYHSRLNIRRHPLKPKLAHCGWKN